MTEHKEVEPVAKMNFGERLKIDFNREIIGVDTGRVVAKFSHLQEAKSFIDVHNAQFTEPNTITIPIAEYEQLKADAERYLFMRENDMTDIYSDFITYKLNPFSVDYIDLDEAIDELRTKNE